jgi:hypothetical protein
VPMMGRLMMPGRRSLCHRLSNNPDRGKYHLAFSSFVGADRSSGSPCRNSAASNAVRRTRSPGRARCASRRR